MIREKSTNVVFENLIGMEIISESGIWDQIRVVIFWDPRPTGKVPPERAVTDDLGPIVRRYAGCLLHFCSNGHSNGRPAENPQISGL